MMALDKSDSETARHSVKIDHLFASEILIRDSLANQIKRVSPTV